MTLFDNPCAMRYAEWAGQPLVGTAPDHGLERWRGGRFGLRMLFKQRFFSWFDSYDVFDEQGEVLYTVKGMPAWGHRLQICDRFGQKLGEVRQELLAFMPRFALYEQEQKIGEIRKEFTFFKPRFALDFIGWQVSGDFWEWEYDVLEQGAVIAHASKQIWNWTDTYAIDVQRPEHALYALMIVLAIDAAKCSQGN